MGLLLVVNSVERVRPPIGALRAPPGLVLGRCGPGTPWGAAPHHRQAAGNVGGAAIENMAKKLNKA